MTTSHDTQTEKEWGGRLSPSDVHNVLFTRAGFGRRGYEEAEVDVFLERVQQELTRLISEKADLRDEVARLKSQLTQAGAAPGAAGQVTKEEAELQAVRLLAAAQQTADVYVADAEKYSQRLTIDAREHSEEIVSEAKRAAEQMVREAERIARDAASRTIEGTTVGTPEPSKEQLDQQVAYLKTFSQVCRVQLRAYLEALLRDVEEEWGKADPGVVLSVPSPGRPDSLVRGQSTALPGGTAPADEDPAAATSKPTFVGKGGARRVGASPSSEGTPPEGSAAVGVQLDEADTSSNGTRGPRHQRGGGPVGHSR